MTLDDNSCFRLYPLLLVNMFFIGHYDKFAKVEFYVKAWNSWSAKVFILFPSFIVFKVSRFSFWLAIKIILKEFSMQNVWICFIP